MERMECSYRVYEMTLLYLVCWSVWTDYLVLLLLTADQTYLLQVVANIAIILNITLSLVSSTKWLL